ncbi:MAG TPA: SusC/RagA family TonB-linked outer membrane protein [Puia sp.]|nr:SusC/RagA family TonB-linked outer membrane protein [Puia sp.]
MTKKLICRRLWGFLCLLFLATGPAFSQKKMPAVKGIVQSEQGELLSGVTVVVENKEKTFTRSVQSDDKGMFVFGSLVKEGPFSFTFSVVGYEKKVLTGYTYDNGEMITLSVKLHQQDKSLSDVVVVGYGTEKKANLTGAVDQVGTEYFDNRPLPSITRGLEGAIPNLNIVVTDGKPTATALYNVRGVTSIGTGSTQGALVLVDGVPGDPTTLNPSDVATVTVLKDAASAAIYGSRGAFGVVLITTKNPTKNKITVTYDASYSINDRTVKPDLVTNGYEFVKYFDSAYYASRDYLLQPPSINSILPFSLPYLDSLKVHNDNPSLPQVTVNSQTGNYNYYGNTDWFKLLYADYIPQTQHSLNVSGGSEKINFSLSGRYFNQGGLFRYNSDNFNRYNLRFKGFIKVNQWLSINSNTDFSTYDYKYPLTANSGSNIWDIISSAAQPVAVMKNPDGTLTQNAAVSVGDLYLGKSFSKSKQVFIRNTLAFTATVIPNRLVLNGDFSYLNTNTVDNRQNFPVPFSNSPGVITVSGNNSLSYNDSIETYLAGNLYAEYQQSFGAHRLKFTVGGNLESDLLKKLMVSKTGLITDNLQDFNLATGSNTIVSGGGSQWSTVGLFYRANYSFSDKYLLELDGRYDGSSKFPTRQQYGFFPSASAGWRVSRENFMQGARGWLDNWKLRASYGALGNGQISPYLYLPNIVSGVNSTIVNGVQPNYLSQPNVIPNGLTWEKSTTLDFGTDIDLLGRRLTINADWYERKTTGMITPGQPQPGVFGAAVPAGNNANLKTDGWEISVNWNDQIRMRKPISYGIRVTVSDNRSRITSFNNPTGTLLSHYKGEKLGDIWGFVSEGFYQSQQDIASSANPSFVNYSQLNIPLPGDIKFKDLNGDKVINNGTNTTVNPGDQKVIGNSSPRYAFGITPFIGWNNFSLSAFFQGLGHRDWSPQAEANFFWGQYNRPYAIMPKSTLDHWTPSNPNGYFPRYRGYEALSFPRELNLPQTRYLQNAAYVRLKNVTLGYNLPTSALQRLHLVNVRFYFTGQNLWTYSPLHKHAPAYDPEVLGSDPQVNAGGAGSDYPMLKTYTFGMNLIF